MTVMADPPRPKIERPKLNKDLLKQSMKKQLETPKVRGNAAFKRADYSQAVTAYGEGLAQLLPDLQAAKLRTLGNELTTRAQNSVSSSSSAVPHDPTLAVKF